jgi:hypothetical protein
MYTDSHPIVQNARARVEESEKAFRGSIPGPEQVPEPAVSP